MRRLVFQSQAARPQDERLSERGSDGMRCSSITIIIIISRRRGGCNGNSSGRSRGRSIARPPSEPDSPNGETDKQKNNTIQWFFVGTFVGTHEQIDVYVSNCVFSSLAELSSVVSAFFIAPSCARTQEVRNSTYVGMSVSASNSPYLCIHACMHVCVAL